MLVRNEGTIPYVSVERERGTVHDALLNENRIPIEMMRASVTQQPLSETFRSNWKFYGPNPR